jgi:hypothetical protein
MRRGARASRGLYGQVKACSLTENASVIVLRKLVEGAHSKSLVPQCVRASSRRGGSRGTGRVNIPQRRRGIYARQGGDIIQRPEKESVRWR